MTSGAVLTAAGSGTRLGHPVPKALVEVGGVAMVVRAAQNLAAAGCLDRMVVTAPAGHLERFAALLDGAGIAVPVTVVPGGATRQASVAAGVAALEGVGVVLVHDAARCLAPPELVTAVERAVRAGRGAVVPGLPVTDTVKQVGSGDDGAEPVVATPDRSTLRAVQTPQGFDRTLLARAHARAVADGVTASDDAALVEALGEPVWVVPGHPRALKVTTATDLALAQVLLSQPAGTTSAVATAATP